MIRERDEKGRVVPVMVGVRCSVCSEPVKSLGFCKKHYLADWRKRHPDYDKTKKKAYWARNRDKRKAIIKRYYENHRAEILERQAAAYRENPDVFNQRGKEWKAANPEASRRQASKRRALLRGTGGDHTVEEIRNLFVKQNGKCAVCRTKFVNKKYNVDHIWPVSRGGSNNIDNIQLLCETCNKSKGAKDPVKFMQSRGLLL